MSAPPEDEPPTIGERTVAYLSPLRRRVEAVRYRGFTPTNMRTRQLYQWAIGVACFVGLFFLGVFYSGINSFGDPRFVIGISSLSFTFGTALMIGFLGLLYLHRVAPKCSPGEMDEYPDFSSAWGKQVRTYRFLDIDNNAKFTTFEMRRLGSLAGGIIKGGGPIVVAALKDTKYDDDILQKFIETGRFSPVPDPKIAGSLEAGFQIGRRYEIPGSADLFVLGASMDGIDFLRPWIRRSYPDLSPLSIVIFIADPLPAKKEVEKITPYEQRTNMEWILADKDREISELRAQLEGTRKYITRGENIRRQAPVVEEREY